MPDSDTPQINNPSNPALSRVWLALAALVIAAGILGTLLAAHAVAHHDATKARTASQEGSTAIASTVKLAIQREEELAVSASTFFARNPKATPEEFSTWVKWARTVHRFPELNNLGLIAVVRTPELNALEARTTALPAESTGQGSVPGAGEGLPIIPRSGHRYYCLATAELVRNPATAPPAGLDYCARTSALLLARGSGQSSVTPVSIGHTQGLASETPVYKGNVTPKTLAGRAAASVGWLRMVLVPGVVLKQALRGHPGAAVSLRYHAGHSTLAFASGPAGGGAQSTTTNLHNGWSMRSFGAAVSGGGLTDGDSLVVLIAGVLASLLLGILIFVLGRVRHSSPAPAATEQPPHEDLYDPLTGLPNRALTLDRAERMVAHAGRQSGMLAGALSIDIDWFEDVNNKLGAAAGDQLLKIVAERLSGVIRAGDTVGRFGGDEFVVLVESAARGVRLDSLARRVIESLHKPVELEGFGPSFFATASIGVAFGRYDTPEDLLRDAQLALYSAKAAGKDRYTMFNANMRSVIESRGVLEAELNTALQERQFFLLYEPIFDMRTRRVVGLEAVLRWQHPKRGVLGPEEFIPLAEDTELIVPIGRWALEEACGRAAAWNVAGHEVAVSVKVSPNQLNRDGFTTDVRRALQQSGIDASLLMLEIAETTAMQDLVETSERLTQLKRLGVRVAIDDFGGSGYARHSDLQRIPLDALKVDRASLARSEDEDYRSWLLEAILIVGRELSLTVIATGIETREQLQALYEMGCTNVQGPLMGKAADATDIERLLTPELMAGDPGSEADGHAQTDGRTSAVV